MITDIIGITAAGVFWAAVIVTAWLFSRQVRKMDKAQRDIEERYRQ